MDRTLVLTASAPIPRDHRVEVTELVEADSGTSIVLAIVDLETGIRYERGDEQAAQARTWTGRVLDCAITVHAHGARTTMLVDPADASGGAGAGDALRGADAAAEAAKAEADRWGGSDRTPSEEPMRIW